MSVLACHRGDCENIMCDRLSQKYGYICRECYEEIKATQPASIKEFMASEKRDPNETPRVDYDRIFPMA